MILVTFIAIFILFKKFPSQIKPLGHKWPHNNFSKNNNAKGRLIVHNIYSKLSYSLKSLSSIKLITIYDNITKFSNFC